MNTNAIFFEPLPYVVGILTYLEIAIADLIGQ